MTSAPPLPPDSEPPQRLGVLAGDRLCIRCGFNLTGQPITREPHYNMLAVRCPECSTLASLQEYPVLGVWAPRFGILLALGWMLAALLIAFLTGLTVYLSAEGVAGVATVPAARQIGRSFAVYRADNIEPEGSGTLYAADNTWSLDDRDPANNWIDPGWLDGQDLHALPTLPGGAASPYNTRALAALIPVLVGAGAWGVVWSVLLLHRRLRGRVIITGVVFALAGGLLVLSHAGSPLAWDGFGPWTTYNWGWGVNARNLAARLYGLTPALVTLAAAFGAFTAGHALGRPVARGIVRLLLPPHCRGPLALLWHVDGLPSPPTRHDAWLRG